MARCQHSPTTTREEIYENFKFLDLNIHFRSKYLGSDQRFIGRPHAVLGFMGPS